MLQSAAKFGKKTEDPAFASLTAADIIRAPVVMRTIALDFVSLVAPYRRHGRLSLRVEYVPQRARLSAGRNNGDGSWSLASDELEGLTYQAPDNLAPEHTLLLRIMALEEAGATTLKILHVPVSLRGPQAGAPAKPEGATARGADGDNPILHNQLDKMQSLFAVREGEVSALRAELEQARSEKVSELAGARAAWELELQQRLSDAVTQAQAVQQKVQKSAVDKHPVQAGQKIARERERWQAQADQRLEAERARWLAESADVLAKSIASERTGWQAQADQRRQAERARWKAESADGLAKSVASERARWQAEADLRLEVEHERWRAESQGGLSQTLAQERANWQAETEQRLEAERRRWEADSAALLTEAAAGWKAQEDQRSAAAQAQWREDSSRLVAEAAEKCRKLETMLAEAMTQSAADRTQSDAVRDELAKVQSILVRRDLELDQYRLSQEQEREHRRQELEASLSAAARAWKMDEDTRLAAMMERARSQSDAALAAAAARCEAAEKALMEAKNGQVPRPADGPIDDSYVQGLQKEISTLRASLVNREVELGHTRAALDRVRARPVQSAAPMPVHVPTPAPIQRMMRSVGSAAPEEPDVSAKRGLVRDFVVAVCVIAPIIFFYPRLEAYLPDEVRANIAAVTGGFLGAAPAPQTQAAAAVVPPVATRKTATVSHAANMRATPGSKGAVVVTLPKGAVVTVVEQHGNWTLVEIAPKTPAEKPQRGFVFGAYLTSNP